MFLPKVRLVYEAKHGTAVKRERVSELYPKKWTRKSCEYGIKRKGTEKWKNLQKKKKKY